MPQPSTEAEWWQPCAELMAREGVSLREAATRLKAPITSEQAASTFRLRGFQKLLRSERNRFFLEIGQDAAWSKRTAIGQMLYLVSRLIDEGQHDKALEGLLKVARTEGWLGAESNVNVFASVSDKELADMRLKLIEKFKEEQSGVN